MENWKIMYRDRPGLDSLIKNFPQPCISFSNGYGIIKSESSLFGAIGISVGMPAVFITYAIPRAFQLIYSPKGEREGEKTEEGRMQMEEWLPH